MPKKKLTPEEKQALVERLKKGKKAITPKSKKEVKPVEDKGRQDEEDNDPDKEQKYPKVETGVWQQRKKRLNKLVADAFAGKHKEETRGVLRSGDHSQGNVRIEGEPKANTNTMN